MPKRHRNRSNRIDNPQYVNNSPLGLNLGQLMGLLGGGLDGGQSGNSAGGNFDISQMANLLGGNVDMSQIQNLLRGISGEGFDMNSLGDLSGIASLLGGLNNGDFGSMGEKGNGGNEEKQNISENKNHDRNIQMLKAVRSLVDPQRAKFIDKIIDMYKKGDISD